MPTIGACFAAGRSLIRLTCVAWRDRKSGNPAGAIGCSPQPRFPDVNPLSGFPQFLGNRRAQWNPNGIQRSSAEPEKS